jgi:hypothetical protein
LKQNLYRRNDIHSRSRSVLHYRKLRLATIAAVCITRVSRLFPQAEIARVDRERLEMIEYRFYSIS